MKSLFDNPVLKREVVKTVIIQPKKQIPLNIFKQLHRIAFFVECMDRLGPNEIIWDETVQEVYSDEIAEAEYCGLQNDFFSVTFELPEKTVKTILGE
jgi:hypothetical protein